ncbi:MAG: hypothetical protein QW727_02330 [Candidatus Pacearchaeota archaeon]
MKRLLVIFAIASLVLALIPVAFAVNVGSGITPSITTEQFAPLVWMCEDRIVTDDNTEPGRFSNGGEPLLERINNYAFEGEQIKWTVLVMDKNKIDQNIDVFATIGDVQGAGNDIEVNCKRVGPVGQDFDSCQAKILEEELDFNPETMDFFECTFTVESPLSMYGEKWVTVEALDGDGLSGTMAENERWFLNPIVALSVEGDLTFDNVRPGTSAFSETILVGNEADAGSGVMMDMFISGTDFYDSSSSGARCPVTNQLSLSQFSYFATNGAYSTQSPFGGSYVGPGADSKGYKGIVYGIGFNDPNPFYNTAEILPAQQIGPYYTANLLAPGAEMALTFRLNMPEPCNGNFDTGSIFFWGEAI